MTIGAGTLSMITGPVGPSLKDVATESVHVLGLGHVPRSSATVVRPISPHLRWSTPSIPRGVLCL